MRASFTIAAALVALASAACTNAGQPANTSAPDNRTVDHAPPPSSPPETQFGAEEAMEGTYENRFEYMDFNGCWFEMNPDALAEFRRLFPDTASGPQPGRSYRLRITGRRSVDSGSAPPLYGHMGGWRCEIQATRILSAERIGGDPPPPPPTDQAPGKPDANSIAAGQTLGAGHDRARLDEQQRNIAPGSR